MNYHLKWITRYRAPFLHDAFNRSACRQRTPVGLVLLVWLLTTSAPMAATAPTALSTATAPLLAIVTLAAIALAALVWHRPRLRGTTLTAPWWWSAASLLVVASAEVLVGLSDTAGGTPSWAAPLRYCAALSTFCPTIAVFGAKRPQDRAWQFIVLSLWAILSLPGGEWWLFGGVQEIHLAWFLFLIVLTLAGALNGVATRHWPSSLLYAAGQLRW